MKFILKLILIGGVFTTLSGCASIIKSQIQTYQIKMVNKYTGDLVKSESGPDSREKNYCNHIACITYSEYGPSVVAEYESKLNIMPNKTFDIQSNASFNIVETPNENLELQANAEPLAVIFPGFGMTTKHPELFAAWLKSIGYNVLVIQGPTESLFFDFNITAAEIISDMLKTKYNHPKVTLVSLSMGSVGALHFTDAYKKVDKYLAVAPMQRFDVAAKNFQKVFASDNWLLSIVPQSSIDEAVNQVIEESKIDGSQTDFLMSIKRINLPNTTVLVSKNDKVLHYSEFENIEKSNVTVDVVEYLNHMVLNSFPVPSKYSPNTIKFIAPEEKITPSHRE
jgi:hypothetical protein